MIANDRDAAMSGRWGGPELTSQIDPSQPLNLRNENGSSCPISAIGRRRPDRLKRVDIRPSLGHCSSIRGGWQLAQLRFERIEIDRLGEEIGGAQFIGAAAPLVVAIGGDHHDREIREALLDLAQ